MPLLRTIMWAYFYNLNNLRDSDYVKIFLPVAASLTAATVQAVGPAHSPSRPESRWPQAQAGLGRQLNGRQPRDKN